MYSVHIPGLFARIELGRCSISIELRKMFLFQFWHTSTTSVIPVPCHFQSRVLTQTLMSEARKLGHYKIQRWRSWGAMPVSVVEELGDGNFRMDQIVAKHFSCNQNQRTKTLLPCKPSKKHCLIPRRLEKKRKVRTLPGTKDLRETGTQCCKKVKNLVNLPWFV